MNRLDKTESAVFLYCRLSLFLMDPFFQIIFLGWVAIRICDCGISAGQRPGSTGCPMQELLDPLIKCEMVV